jgi:diguanylate cyclase (GGDEF)-like protein
MGQTIKTWLARSIPRGNQLSEESWERRHVAIVILLWAHVVALPWVGLATGSTLLHSLTEASIVAVFALGASIKRLSAPTRSVFTTIGLITSSAVLTHFSGGLIEMHFHFFIMVAVITLYQSWLPFAFAIGYVLVHHGLAGALDPTSVFNHPEAITHPWRWATVHAIFIAGESLACLTAWRLNELALENERATSHALERANHDLAEAQELASIGSWEWDMGANTVRWSEELYRILGVDPVTFSPSVEAFMDFVHPDDRLHLTVLLDSVRNGAETLETDLRIVRLDRSERIVRAMGSLAPDRTSSSGGTRMVGTCQDVTEQKHLEDEIEYKAFHDPLTGLANRGLFKDRLAHSVKRRNADGVAVIFLDLDDFKSVNDRLGHGAGDRLLTQVARTLESLVRESDTIARFGGDEFAILVDDDGSRAAVGVAQRIVSAFSQPVAIEDGEVTVQPSMGVAFADGNTSPDDLLRDADIAMYVVKAEGKGGFEVCSSEMRQTVLHRLEMKTELEAAIENQEFTLHFQPVVCLDSTEVIALEALVRWEHPRWGLVSPGEFIPLAEETGLIVPLGTWVLNEATKQARQLQDSSGRRFKINVNLSARQLREQDVVSVVQQALLSSGIRPSDLTLEVTETVLMQSVEFSQKAIADLRKTGVQIAIDDFGTGYSSLSYLHKFPIDVLKIDRAFVVGAGEGRGEEALARAVIELAASLDMETVAEGIETHAQWNKMIELGCKRGQGFLFSRPLPHGEIEQWLRHQPKASPAELAVASANNLALRLKY